MKTIKFSFFAMILAFGSIFTSCNDEEEMQQPQNIVEKAIATPELSSLVQALQKAGLVEALKQGNYTVLAPTNQAFQTFLQANGFASLEDVPVDVLSNVLLNHVIDANIKSSNLVTMGNGYTSTLAKDSRNNNLSLYFNTSSGVKFNGISSVITADIEATNGVIHIVDKVIGLPTVVTFATADPNFSTLVAALTRSDLTTNFVQILSTPNGTGPTPFTVFAPTNAAFSSLLTELSISGLGDISEPVLNSTLKYHVVGGANVRSSALTENMSVPTLGGTITAYVNGGAKLKDANNRTSNITYVDVQATNGVIHVIDKVTLPPL